MSEFKIATFNMHHGRSRGSLYSPKSFIAGLKALDADVLCVQEIDYRSLRTFFVDQSKYIAEHLEYKYSTVKVRFFGSGYECLTTFSRYPILSFHEELLPKNFLNQQRRMLSTAIFLDGQEVDIVNVHLQASKRKRNVSALDQLEFVLESILSAGHTVLAGDFNLEPSEVVPLAERFQFQAPHDFFTTSSHNVKHQIDWLLGKNVLFSNVKASDHIVGDHRALSAEVNVP